MTSAVIAPRRAGFLGVAGALGLLLGLTGAYVPGVPEPRPNILYNGSMEIDQANEGNSVSLTSGANAFVLDGWSAGFHSAGAAVSCQRSTDAPAGFANSLRCTVATGASIGAGDYLFVRQPIEANDLVNLPLGTGSATQVCLSFQVKSSIGPYTFSAALQNYAGSRSYPVNFTVGSSATWSPVSACFTLDTGGAWVTSGSSGGAYLIVAAVVGTTYQGAANAWGGSAYYGTAANTNTILSTTGATFAVTGVNLVQSPVPTPYARRPFAQELALCQRYFEKSYDLGAGIGSVTVAGAVRWVVWASGTFGLRLPTQLRVPKRVDPTVTIYSPVTGSAGFLNDVSGAGEVAAAVNSIGMGSFNAVAGGTWGQGEIPEFHWVADARLNP